jgi:hypothetical protein
MTPAAASVYVWFRVPAAQERAVVSALRAQHSAWRASMPGLDVELVRRGGEHGGDVTLMEVCRRVAPLERKRIAREGAACLAAWPAIERHVEVFEPCA